MMTRPASQRRKSEMGPSCCGVPRLRWSVFEGRRRSAEAKARSMSRSGGEKVQPDSSLQNIVHVCVLNFTIFSIFKCTIQWHPIYIVVLLSSPSISWTSLFFQNWNCVPIKQSLIPTPGTATYFLFPISPTLGTSCTCNYPVFLLLQHFILLV